MSASAEQLAEELLQLLSEQHKVIATAESCTGGWVAKILTDFAGSSNAFDRGYVTYSNAAKVEMLGVSDETLEKTGAVSEATAAEMATGAVNQSQADIAVSITGIAGPGGGSDEKPVGTVCFGWATIEGDLKAETMHFQGDRNAVRLQSVQHCLLTALEIIRAQHY